MKNEELVPKVRFKGFNDPWEQRKLSEIYVKNVEKNNGQFDISKTISIANMYFKKGGNGASAKSIDNYKVLRRGDIAFEGNRSKYFSYGRMVMNDIGDGIMSPRFTTLRPISKQIISFWKILIHYEPIMKYILVLSTKKGTMMNELVINDFLKNSLKVPTNNEQKRIGDVFKKLDNLIAANEDKLEQLKQLKKLLMQKIFSQDWRFKGFTDPWEQRKLGQVSKVFDSARIPNNIWKSSGVPYLRSSDINQNGIVPSLFISESAYKDYKSKTGAPEQGDLLFTSGGQIGLTYLKVTKMPLYVQGGAVLYVKTSKSNFIDGLYLKYYFESSKMKKYMKIASTGLTLHHFTLQPASNAPITFSTMDEQKMIGECFKLLNDLIAANEDKLEQLKQVKKFLMQNMFA